MIECACGCKTLIEPKDNRHRPRRYVWGHANIRKMIEGNRGKPPWNKGKKLHYTVWNKGYGDYMLGAANHYYGKKHTPEIRAKMSGVKNGNWKNGASSKNQLIRKSAEYIEWRASVFIRDGRKCIWCGSKSKIEADHIKPFSTYPELRFDLSNGRTLCLSCHKKTETYGNKKKLRRPPSQTEVSQV